jgi:hypothetical protein
MGIYEEATLDSAIRQFYVVDDVPVYLSITDYRLSKSAHFVDAGGKARLLLCSRSREIEGHLRNHARNTADFHAMKRKAYARVWMASLLNFGFGSTFVRSNTG